MSRQKWVEFAAEIVNCDDRSVRGGRCGVQDTASKCRQQCGSLPHRGQEWGRIDESDCRGEGSQETRWGTAVGKELNEVRCNLNVVETSNRPQRVQDCLECRCHSLLPRKVFSRVRHLRHETVHGFGEVLAGLSIDQVS
jgi:hypothetical protein